MPESTLIAILLGAYGEVWFDRHGRGKSVRIGPCAAATREAGSIASVVSLGASILSTKFTCAGMKSGQAFSIVCSLTDTAGKACVIWASHQMCSG